MTETTENDIDNVTETETKAQVKPQKKHFLLWGLLTVSVVGIGAGTYFAAPRIKSYLENLKAPTHVQNVLPVPEVTTIVDEPVISKAICEEHQALLLEKQQFFLETCHEGKKELENKLSILQKEFELIQKQLTTLQHAPQQNLAGQVKRLTDLLIRINNGKPFISYLTDLKKGMATNPLLEQIDQELGFAGATGIPTVSEIQKTFTLNAPDYEKAVMTCEKEQSTWYGKLWFKLKTLVRIRPVVIPEDATCPRWLFYKASDEIAVGNIEQALITLRQLPTEKQHIFIPLMKQMELRLKLTYILSEMGENK